MIKIKLQRLIQKAIILKYRIKKTPVLMVFNEQTIKVIYGKNNKYISFPKSNYLDVLLNSIDKTIELTHKKPIVIKV